MKKSAAITNRALGALSALLPLGIKKEVANYLRNKLQLTDTFLARKVARQSFLFSNSNINPKIVLYFGDRRNDLYQVEQWAPVLEKIARTHETVIVTRHYTSYASIGGLTKLPRVLIRTIDALEQFYTSYDIKLCLYVNNSSTNFYSLAHSKMLHVHLNHGESDKNCMSSNQIKAYDYGVVCGQKAIHRYRDNLKLFSIEKLIQVGRPQLDYIEDLSDSVIPETKKYTVIYAPTWESARNEMNYTSIDTFGVKLMQALLQDSRFRVIYKPHPKSGTVNRSVEQCNNRITEMVMAHDSALFSEDSILALYKQAHLLITDISSVVIDYMVFDKPFLTAEPRQGMKPDMQANSAGGLVNGDNVRNIGQLCHEAITKDPYKQQRNQLVEYYFHTTFNSSALFEKQIKSLIETGLPVKDNERSVEDLYDRSQEAVA